MQEKRRVCALTGGGLSRELLEETSHVEFHGANSARTATTRRGCSVAISLSVYIYIYISLFTVISDIYVHPSQATLYVYFRALSHQLNFDKFREAPRTIGKRTRRQPDPSFLPSFLYLEISDSSHNHRFSIKIMRYRTRFFAWFVQGEKLKKT